MVRILCLWIVAVCCFAAEVPLMPPYDDAILRAREAEAKGLMGKAISELEIAQKLDPKRMEGFFHAGRIHAKMRRHEKAVAAFTTAIELNPKFSANYNMRGWELFCLGQLDKAIADFDKFIELEPRQGPEHWQRGIALYLAGKYEAARQQFELHQRVNSEDVENAVFHFCSVAKLDGFKKAESRLIEIHEDRRVPMMEIYRLFAGKGTVDEVLKAVTRGDPAGEQLEMRTFFAHYYLGLYFEAKGEPKEAYEHFKLAATDYAQDHAMGEVAKVHFQRLLKSTTD